MPQKPVGLIVAAESDATAEQIVETFDRMRQTFGDSQVELQFVIPSNAPQWALERMYAVELELAHRAYQRDRIARLEAQRGQMRAVLEQARQAEGGTFILHDFGFRGGRHDA